MEVLDISPDTLTVFIEKKTEKKLKIKPDFDLSFKTGYGLASEIEIFPESTIVLGPASVIRNLNNIPTQKFELNNLDRKVVEQVRLKNIQGMSYSANIVTMNLDVQKIVDKNLENIHVNILDVPRDREVVLLPNRISVGIRGGINILGKISEDQLNAYVYYRDVVLDTLGSVTPYIDLPDNATLIFVRPEWLKYIIKKFN
jgi:YbbR domain-containing protein